jgi:hypothetical protein
MKQAKPLAAQGVSAYPQAVTAQIVAHMRAGGAAVSVLARQHGLARWGSRAVRLVGHHCWITALVHLPRAAVAVDATLDAAQWPAAPRHGALVRRPPAPDAVHPG